MREMKDVGRAMADDVGREETAESNDGDKDMAIVVIP